MVICVHSHRFLCHRAVRPATGDAEYVDDVEAAPLTYLSSENIIILINFIVTLYLEKKLCSRCLQNTEFIRLNSFLN